LEISKGTILAFYGAHLSGLAHLQIVDIDTGNSELIPCENAATVRALESMFGDVIAPGHTVDPAGGHIDQDVYWSYDEQGLILGGMTPVNEASQDLIELYESEGEHAEN